MNSPKRKVFFRKMALAMFSLKVLKTLIGVVENTLPFNLKGKLKEDQKVEQIFLFMNSSLKLIDYQ